MSESEDVIFMNYISSLVLQAMIFLGEAVHPVTNQIQKNLGQAKILIDTLGVLVEKTRGNLTQQEEALLTSSILQLREKYEAAVDGA